MDPNIVWALIFVAGAVYEAYGIFNKADGDTLSERTRDWFKVHTGPGRATFLVLWALFSLWFLVHIVWAIV